MQHRDDTTGVRLEQHIVLRLLVFSAAALLLSGCGASSWLDAPLQGGVADWMQEGGNAQRTHTYASAPGAGVAAWEFSMDAAAGRAEMLLRGETVLFPSITMILETARLSDGEQNGAFPVEGIIAATPAILNDKLYIATDGGNAHLYCYSLENAALQWKRRTGAVQAGLCAFDDAVFAATVGGLVYRFSEEDSLPQWTRELKSPVYGAPAAADSILVVGTAAGDVYGLSVNTGETMWREPTFAAVQAGPVIQGPRVFAANHEGRVVAIDLHSGQKLWELETGVPVYYPAAVTSARLVLALSDGTLLVVDPQSGTILQSTEIGELPGAAPLLLGNTVYQLLRKGILLRIDLESGAIAVCETLPLRSETAPLLTPRGIVLADEDGEAVMSGCDKAIEDVGAKATGNR
ncbi:PQQ-binding-like beta-propeller repeat protein [bacterium]|nr:PQQ-binding-like beta-propeller repeat protein [bacterium]